MSHPQMRDSVLARGDMSANSLQLVQGSPAREGKKKKGGKKRKRGREKVYLRKGEGRRGAQGTQAAQTLNLRDLLCRIPFRANV